MIERILHSRAFIAYTLACATGLTLDRYYCPWPSGDLMLRLVAVREPVVYAGLYYTLISARLKPMSKPLAALA